MTVLLQLKPPSTVHAAEQPSAPLGLPSSQVSSSSRAPLPHFLQMLGAPPPGCRQVQPVPVSIWHVAEQPSPPVGGTSPSSQFSPLSMLPLPQRLQTLGPLPTNVFAQVQPPMVSTWQ